MNMLLEVSLYAALVTGAILLFRRIFGKRLSPALRYGVWFLLLLRLALPFTVESGVHLISLPAPTAAVPLSDLTGAGEGASFAAANVPALEPIEPQGADGGVFQPQAQLPPADEPYSAGRPSAPFNWQGLLLGLWIGGVAAQFGYYVLGFLKITRVRRRGCPPPQGALDMLAACKAELGVRSRVGMVVAEGEGSPALLPGRCILLPKEVVQNETSLRYALLHELTHIRRRDHLVSALIQVLCCVYWFHPAVRWGLCQMRADMEAACDADVTARLNAPQRKSYYMMLIDLFSAEPAPALGMAGGTRRMAKQRIAASALPRQTRTLARLATGLLAAALFICCFTTACQPRQEQGGVTIEPGTPTTLDSDLDPGLDLVPPQTSGLIPDAGGVASNTDVAASGANATPIPQAIGEEAQVEQGGALATPAPTPQHIGEEAQAEQGGAFATPAPTPQPAAMEAAAPSADAEGWAGAASESGESGVDASRLTAIIKRLRELGYPGIVEEGAYPSYAVGLFQRQNGLLVDGIFGAVTDKALFSKTARPYLLELGVEGTDVAALQRYLKAMNYLKKITGYFGTETEAALRAYQSAKGQKASGKADGHMFQMIAAEAAKYAVGGDTLVEAAVSMLGVKYVRSGKIASGVDAGGLVYYCLNQIGLPVKYKTSEQWAESDFLTISSMKDLLPGDIVCFKGHVGIYTGDGGMIDSSSSEGKVRQVSNLMNSNYWNSVFICGKRVI